MTTRRRLSPLVLFVLAAFALACGAFEGKPVPADKQAYIGQWGAVGMDLTLTADGGLSYNRTGGAGNSSVNAPVQVWADDRFEAGIGPLTTTFKVDVAPHEEGGVWKMTIDGVELTRQR